MTLSIKPPYPAFFDRDGRALEAGYIWIGTADLEPITNPIPVYWDEGLTIPASLPVRTTGGYPSRSGSPAVLYVNGDYSITVQNRVGMLIYTAPNVTEVLDGVVVIISLSSLTFTQAGTGAVSRTALSKMRDVYTLKDFGAVGNGSSNDAVAVQAAFDAVVAAGGTIDGQNLVYKVNSNLDLNKSNVTLQNITFDFSSYVGSHCIDIAGTLGVPSSLTSDLGVYDTTVTIADTAGFTAEDLVFLKSSRVWDAQTSTTYGQYARIKTIDSSNQMTLYNETGLAYAVADGATVALVTPRKNIRFINCVFKGAQNITLTQMAVHVEYGEGIRFTDCEVFDIDYTGFALWRCYDSVVRGCSFSYARNANASYGIGIWGGCYDTVVTECQSDDLRHSVSVGDNDGINFNTVVSNCTFNSCKDSAIDSHSASMFFTAANNIIRSCALRTGTSNHDGMISEGANTTFIGNTVVGFLGNGISVTPKIQDGTPVNLKIMNNTIVMDDKGYEPPAVSSIVGVYVFNDATYGPGIIDSVMICGNTLRGALLPNNGSIGFRLSNHKASSTITNVIINDNIVEDQLTSLCIYVQAAGVSSVISKLAICGNVLNGNVASVGMQMSPEGASSSIVNGTIGNNVFDNIATGIYLNAAGGSSFISNFRCGLNTYDTVTTMFALAGDVRNAFFDDAKFVPVSTITGATTTIGIGNHWIFNRGTAIVATLPDPTKYLGRTMRFKNIQAQTVDSNASNVVPIDSDTAGTSILLAVDGAWADLYCNGTNWVIFAQG